MDTSETTRPGEAVSVVVPTFNEAANLPELLGRLKANLDGRILYEVVIADDRSPDGTAQLAEALGRELSIPLRVVTRPPPRSLSLSVIEGARAARFDCVAVLDADLSHDPEDLVGLVHAVASGECDVVVASRYADGGAILDWPLWRRLLSAAGTRLARSLSRARDPLSGFFACRRALFTGEIDLHPRGYKILLELLARGQGLRVKEFPTRFEDRRRGSSKLRLRQHLEFLAQVLSLIALHLRTLIPFHSQPRRVVS